MLPGADTNAIRRVPNAPLDDLRAPDHVVALELAVEIVGEERRVQEAFGGQIDVGPRRSHA